jgi:hypothetical protein
MNGEGEGRSSCLIAWVEGRRVGRLRSLLGQKKAGPFGGPAFWRDFL